MNLEASQNRETQTIPPYEVEDGENFDAILNKLGKTRDDIQDIKYGGKGKSRLAKVIGNSRNLWKGDVITFKEKPKQEETTSTLSQEEIDAKNKKDKEARLALQRVEALEEARKEAQLARIDEALGDAFGEVDEKEKEIGINTSLEEVFGDVDKEEAKLAKKENQPKTLGSYSLKSFEDKTLNASRVDKKSKPRVYGRVEIHKNIPSVDMNSDLGDIYANKTKAEGRKMNSEEFKQLIDAKRGERLAREEKKLRGSIAKVVEDAQTQLNQLNEDFPQSPEARKFRKMSFAQFSPEKLEDLPTQDLRKLLKQARVISSVMGKVYAKASNEYKKTEAA